MLRDLFILIVFTTSLAMADWVSFEKEIKAYKSSLGEKCQNITEIKKTLTEIEKKVPEYYKNLFVLAEDEVFRYTSQKSTDVFELKKIRNPLQALFLYPLHDGCTFPKCDERDDLLVDRWTSGLKNTHNYVLEKNGKYTGITVSLVAVSEKGKPYLFAIPLENQLFLETQKMQSGRSLLEGMQADIARRFPNDSILWVKKVSDKHTGYTANGRSLKDFYLTDPMAKAVAEVITKPCVLEQDPKLAKSKIGGDDSQKNPKLPGLPFNANPQVQVNANANSGVQVNNSVPSSKTITTTNSTMNTTVNNKNGGNLEDLPTENGETKGRAKNGFGGDNDRPDRGLGRSPGFNSFSNGSSPQGLGLKTPSFGDLGNSVARGGTGSGGGSRTGSGSPSMPSFGSNGRSPSNTGRGNGSGGGSGDVADNGRGSESGPLDTIGDKGETKNPTNTPSSKGDSDKKASPSKPVAEDSELKKYLTEIKKTSTVTGKDTEKLIDLMSKSDDIQTKKLAAEIYAERYYKSRGNFANNQDSLQKGALSERTAREAAMLVKEMKNIKHVCEVCETCDLCTEHRGQKKKS